jgi:hypothetical protein
MRKLVSLAAVAFASLALAARPAAAEVKRFALLVGANHGFAHEVPLRYAESDVDAVATTLAQVGGYASERIVTLKAPSPDRLRNALVDAGLAIQRELRGGGEATLFVYFSGHGDGESLHLGARTFSTEELAKLVRLSPAKLKLLLLDACRAGALTRVKGGRQVAPFQIGLADELRNEGFAVITSSAAGEDAQESDALRSSVFTHHFLAALRGPGDANRDRVVTLGEAYAYAYDQALKTSLGTVAGSQHATFEYDLRGRADPVLADLRAAGEQATLTFALPGDYLLAAASGAGAPWEIAVATADTAVLVPAASYRVRLRTRTAVLEGDVALAQGESRRLGPRELRPVPLAQVVRKGDAGMSVALGPSLAGSIHGPLGDGFSPTLGGQAGFAFELPQVTLLPRVGFGRADATTVPAGIATHTVTELSLELTAMYVLDAGRVSFAPLASIGSAFLWQRVDRGAACAPGDACTYTRTPKALLTSVGAWVGLPLGGGASLEATLELVSYYLGKQSSPQDEAGAAARSGSLTYRAGLGLGYRY